MIDDLKDVPDEPIKPKRAARAPALEPAKGAPKAAGAEGEAVHPTPKKTRRKSDKPRAKKGEGVRYTKPMGREKLEDDGLSKAWQVVDWNAAGGPFSKRFPYVLAKSVEDGYVCMVGPKGRLLRFTSAATALQRSVSGNQTRLSF